MMVTLARAVHYAHQRGILHRDLKPANILIDQSGSPHITDFGLAKQIESLAELTVSGAVMGTPGYMAPEQAAGRSRQVTTTADTYSLGGVLYYLLTGQPPFKAASAREPLNQVIDQEPRRPSSAISVVDRDLETICLKCLQKLPARRYASAEALAEDLELWLAHRPIKARPITDWERAAKWARRHPTGAMAIAFVVMGGSVWQWPGRSAGGIRLVDNFTNTMAKQHSNDTNTARVPSRPEIRAKLTEDDFSLVANFIAESILKELVDSGKPEVPTNRPLVFAISMFRNNTSQPLNLEPLHAQIRVALIGTSKVVFGDPSAGPSHDPLMQRIKTEEDFLKNKRKTSARPDYSLTGDISERRDPVEHQSIFLFGFKLTNRDNLIVWENKKTVIKQDR